MSRNLTGAAVRLPEKRLKACAVAEGRPAAVRAA
jgi:hypothetical protein